MKLGVICEGISRELSHALNVMDEFGLDYAELQCVGDTEVGEHSKQEIAAIKTLLEPHNKPVPCLSPLIAPAVELARGRGADAVGGTWQRHPWSTLTMPRVG